MHRSFAFTMAVLVGAVFASPALAARSAPNLGTRGTVTVTISDDKTDASQCVVKVTGKRLADGQNVYVASYPMLGYAWDIAATTSDGGVVNHASPASDDEVNKSRVLVVIGPSWQSVFDVDGNEATWSINNTCKD